MDLQKLLEIGAQAFRSGVGSEVSSSLSLDSIKTALAGLLPGEGNQVDLAALVGLMQNGGLASIAQSWLGDGGNQSIGTGQLLEMFGGDSVRTFASKLGLDETTALNGLKKAVPSMVDQASSGGVLDSIGGLSGAMGLASKFFK